VSGDNGTDEAEAFQIEKQNLGHRKGKGWLQDATKAM
jgi:hypothetical protein